MMNQGHKILNLVLIFGLAIVFTITTVFNFIAGALGPESGIFNSNVGNLSDKYDTTITPAGWTFSIWSLIYLWLAAIFIWYIATIFIKSSSELGGGPLYLNPEVVTPLYSVVMIANLLMNLAWIFIWDNELLIASSVFLFLIAATNMIALGVLANRVAGERSVLKTMQSKSYCAYVLCLNGHGIYTTWTTIASLINLVIALHYSGDVAMITCTRLSLSLLLIVIVAWFILENTVLDSRFRLVLTPYLVVIWASSGVISGQANATLDIPDETKGFAQGILGVAIALFIARLGIVIFRQVKRPLSN